MSAEICTTYSECIRIKNLNLSLIGTFIKHDDVEYRITDILIMPTAQTKLFLIALKQDGKSSAENRFATRNDLTLNLLLEDLRTFEDLVIEYDDFIQ